MTFSRKDGVGLHSLLETIIFNKVLPDIQVMCIAKPWCVTYTYLSDKYLFVSYQLGMPCLSAANKILDMVYGFSRRSVSICIPG